MKYMKYMDKDDWIVLIVFSIIFFIGWALVINYG